MPPAHPRATPRLRRPLDGPDLHAPGRPCSDRVGRWIASLGTIALVAVARPAAGLENLLLVVLDTTRADAFSFVGTPHTHTPETDRLAREGVRFEFARSTSAWTLPSHASLFTGLYPSRHGATHESHLLAEENRTLAEVLADSHQSAGFSENPHIVRAKGFAQGFDLFVETWRGSRPRDTPPPTIDAALAWLGSRDPSKPFFLFLNLMDAHLPYRPASEWAARIDPELAASARAAELRGVSERQAREFMMGTLALSREDLATLRLLYHAEVAQADARLARVMGALRAEGRLDDTVVVLVGDHGENLGEHGLMEHQLCLFEPLLRVPFLIRAPSVFDPGTVRRGPVQLVDLAPTLFEILGVPPESRPRMEGRSLLPGDPPDERPVIAEYMRPLRQRARFAGAPERFDMGVFDRRLRSIQVGRLKLIVSDRGERWLYDLREDPGELHDLSQSRPEAREALEARLQEWLALRTPAEDAAAPELDAETVRALRALGYME